ncbi:MAG: C4-type zinc ribbon domain-containing protein [Candidatus Binatus sp.]|uniref:zinc ribbon domain-containing protein n=1 Tax=Candidatus Binatus sp. TaxID=2811406 RepID=UPI002722A308|nr:C4-type zinc ribbon domain-containing protein [Candidatus Binatus sp.]MDO8432714.1 C4-type zinc ribbon domain-containing protein [Candidatus Binatus sp.]
MREEINRLMELQTIDRQLKELEESLSSIAGQVVLLREQLEGNQQELDRLTEQDAEIIASRKKAERELAEGEVRIRNKRMRLTLIRNEKELQALSHEIETLKDTNQRIEAELLATLEGADERTAKIKELTQAIAKGRAELAKAEKEIAAEVEQLKASIEKHNRSREQVAAAVEPNLLSRYKMIFNRRAGVAVALAKGGTCQGCRMRLPPQLYNEIQKHLQIHFCPNCQRVLYYEG